ncbi:MAG: hypothetical protein VKK98_09885 [Cyanobacteriota bacterium]|nr:hypothetical protein [Cyanobacteriota bacterium]
MLIYACVSAHGFGHGARTAAVLSALHQRRPEWRLVLSTALPPRFLGTAFGEVPYEQRPLRWDVGMVQADALGSDPAATLAALEQLERTLPQHLAREAQWIRDQHEPVLVLADVPPAAALLAEAVAAPLVWLASFGWDAIYAPLGGAFQTWADHCTELYRRGDLLLRCPLGMPMPWNLPELRLGLTAGRPRLPPAALAELAERLELPAERQRCVLVAFGGLGARLDPHLLDLWPSHLFLSSDPELALRPNGRLVPDGLRPLELLPRCGRMITKPGYSSFCEALSAGVGLHVVQREGFSEAAVLQADLQRHGWHRLLSQQALFSGDWQLDQPLLPPSGHPLPTDGSERAAETLANMQA